MRHLTDKLGKPVDENIVEIVAILRLIGINTTSSCAGHYDRITNGPYVNFTSIDNEKLVNKMREVGDRTHPEYKRLFHKCTYNSLKERQKLLPYLESFYDNRIVPYNQRIIMGYGPAKNCMMCQGAELGYVFDLQERNELLNKNMKEVKHFTTHLKLKYFNSSANPHLLYLL